MRRAQGKARFRKVSSMMSYLCRAHRARSRVKESLRGSNSARCI